MLAPAMEMYANNGYRMVKEEEYGAIDVRYFEKELTGPPVIWSPGRT
jgi:hypothetical protein